MPAIRSTSWKRHSQKPKQFRHHVPPRVIVKVTTLHACASLPRWARDLAEIASHIRRLKGDANAYLSDPNYNTLRLRLEIAHSAVEAAAAAVEARRRVRLSEGR